VPETWKALYASPVIGVYLLGALPVLFLGALAARGIACDGGVEPYAARFVRGWAIVFALVALVDPVTTGLFGWPMLPFVLLGDYRVFALVLVVMEPGRARAAALAEAAAWTLVVPALAYGCYRALEVLHGPQPEPVLWLVYEVAFALLAAGMIGWLVPARVGIERGPVRRYLRVVLGVVVAYYVLWAAADVITLSGHDWGWGLRIVPNLLYYGALVPVAYACFFPSAIARSSTSSQAST